MAASSTTTPATKVDVSAAAAAATGTAGEDSAAVGEKTDDAAARDAPPLNRRQRHRQKVTRIMGRLTVFGLALAFGVDRLVQFIEGV